jgi:hypothetical protein
MLANRQNVGPIANAARQRAVRRLSKSQNEFGLRFRSNAFEWKNYRLDVYATGKVQLDGRQGMNGCRCSPIKTGR